MIDKFLESDEWGSIAVKALVYCGKVNGLSHSQALAEMLAFCTPNSKWVPGLNSGKIEAARKGTSHPTSYANASR